MLANGFKETEIGLIPAEWEVTQLGDVFAIQQGKALAQRHRAGKSPSYFLRTANVLWGGLDVSNLDQMDFTSEEREKFQLKKDDLLICEGGEIGRTAIWNNEVPDCYFQNHLFRVRANNGQVFAPFYRFWMQAALTILGLYQGYGNKTTIPNLSKQRLASFVIPIPPLKEQQQIAHVLDTIQQAIAAQSAVLQAARELKRALMRRLFTYGPDAEERPTKETEIGRIPEYWQVIEFGAACKFIQYGTSQKCDENIRGVPVLRIPNVIEGFVDTTDLKFARFSEAETARFRLQVGDILFVRTNGRRERTGRCAIFRGELKQSLFASYLIRAQVKPKTLLPEFVRYYTMTTQGQSFLSGKASPAADGKFNINSQTIKSMLIPFPSLEEQEKITQILEVFEHKLAIEENRMAALSALFTATLHQLMTGHLRLLSSLPQLP